MKFDPPVSQTGLFDMRYAAFLETVASQRTRLHRYCSRMTGSALDGEDVMQEALFEAYRKVDQLDDPAALRSWLFRIVHNRCIDFLRKRNARRGAEQSYAQDDIILPADAAGKGTEHAIERLVIHLPPKERACVLLKDVFDYSLDEIAGLIGSTVGGVKSALKRGRTKLEDIPDRQSMQSRERLPSAHRRLLNRYVELFNRRDWDGVRNLTSADARLRVADCFDGMLRNSPYFAEYERSALPWQIKHSSLGGEPGLVLWQYADGLWRPAWPVRVRIADNAIVEISDYYACPWLLPMIESAQEIQ